MAYQPVAPLSFVPQISTSSIGEMLDSFATRRIQLAQLEQQKQIAADRLAADQAQHASVLRQNGQLADAKAQQEVDAKNLEGRVKVAEMGVKDPRNVSGMNAVAQAYGGQVAPAQQWPMLPTPPGMDYTMPPIPPDTITPPAPGVARAQDVDAILNSPRHTNANPKLSAILKRKPPSDNSRISNQFVESLPIGGMSPDMGAPPPFVTPQADIDAEIQRREAVAAAPGVAKENAARAEENKQLREQYELTGLGKPPSTGLPMTIDSGQMLADKDRYRSEVIGAAKDRVASIRKGLPSADAGLLDQAFSTVSSLTASTTPSIEEFNNQVLAEYDKLKADRSADKRAELMATSYGAKLKQADEHIDLAKESAAERVAQNVLSNHGFKATYQLDKSTKDALANISQKNAALDRSVIGNWVQSAQGGGQRLTDKDISTFYGEIGGTYEAGEALFKKWFQGGEIPDDRRAIMEEAISALAARALENEKKIGETVFRRLSASPNLRGSTVPIMDAYFPTWREFMPNAVIPPVGGNGPGRGGGSSISESSSSSLKIKAIR